MINLDKSENWNNREDWEKTKKEYYGSKTVLQVYGGIIDFDPGKKQDLVGGDKLSYNEYLELQMMACENKGNVRRYFALCCYYIPLEFMGQIERITEKAICFKRIFVSGMYPDGTCFDGKEDHVWIEKQGFEGYAVGDCLSFFAEPYRYMKTGNGKQIDFGLRKPQSIRKINEYELPSDDELMLQSIDAIICESCYLNGQCGETCLRSRKELQPLKKDMFKTAKGTKKNKKKSDT